MAAGRDVLVKRNGTCTGYVSCERFERGRWRFALKRATHPLPVHRRHQSSLPRAVRSAPRPIRAGCLSDVMSSTDSKRRRLEASSGQRKAQPGMCEREQVKSRVRQAVPGLSLPLNCDQAVIGGQLSRREASNPLVGLQRVTLRVVDTAAAALPPLSSLDQGSTPLLTAWQPL